MKKSKDNKVKDINVNQENAEDVNVAENNATETAEKEAPKELTTEDKLAKAQEELVSAKDQNLRLYAEFENFKRRNAKERIELMSSANLELMQTLLPVVDDFERAIKNTERTDENKSVVEGLELIYAKLTDVLKQKGLKPMESTIGQAFDVETMEAITRLPVPDKKQDGKVLDEVERGYHLGSKVLRYARVVVAHHDS